MKAVPTGINPPTPSTFNSYSGVALLYGDLVLLCKRIALFKGEPVNHGGYWSPFAGTVEKGESPISAAVRELWEESGLKIGVHELTYIKEIPRDDGSFILYVHELDKLFIPSLNYEHTEYGYFRIDSIDYSPFPVCPAVAEAIQGFDRISRRAG